MADVKMSVEQYRLEIVSKIIKRLTDNHFHINTSLTPFFPSL